MLKASPLPLGKTTHFLPNIDTTSFLLRLDRNSSFSETEIDRGCIDERISEKQASPAKQ